MGSENINCSDPMGTSEVQNLDTIEIQRLKFGSHGIRVLKFGSPKTRASNWVSRF